MEIPIINVNLPKPEKLVWGEDYSENKDRTRIYKILAYLVVIAALIVFFRFIFFSYVIIKNIPKINSYDANIDSVVLSEDGKFAYIRLSGGNRKDIESIIFIFKSSDKNYSYETKEGIKEISYPKKSSIWNYFLDPSYEGSFDYVISSENFGLSNFSSIYGVEVIIKYKDDKTGETKERKTDERSGINNRGLASGGGSGSGSGGGSSGGGSGGGSCTNDLGCSTAGLFCDGNNPYNCNLGGDGCLDKVNLIACTGNQVCVNGQGCVLLSCTSDLNCVGLNGDCGQGFCNQTNKLCQVKYNSTTNVCRAVAGECDLAEKCTGSSQYCPNDIYKPEGTLCTSDNLYCNGIEKCQSGICSHPGNPCEDNFDCSINTCYETNDTCSIFLDNNFCLSKFPKCTSSVCSAILGCTDFSPVGCNDLYLNTGLIGYWTFDEGAGNILHDSSGNNYNGVLNGSTWISNGKIGGALNFDGINDYVDLGDVNSYEFGPDDSFSISMWIKPATKSNFGIFGREGRYDNYNTFIISGSSYYDLYFKSSDGIVSSNSDFGGKYAVNNWTHILVTSGKTGENISFYVNGKLYKSINRNPTNFYGDISSFKIGAGRTSFFNGSIDELRIYNRKLSNEEIKSLSGGQTGAGQKTYTLTISSEGGGKIVPSGIIKVDEYSNLTLKIIPERGFKVSDIIIDSISQGELGSLARPYYYTISNINKNSNYKFKFSFNNVLAFPGAEGFGAYTSGGRGGKIIHVTNLNDSGAGSLRWALSQTGPRIIVFDVGGNIELKSDLSVTPSKHNSLYYNPDVWTDDFTIAGQTAPGGITLSGTQLVIMGGGDYYQRANPNASFAPLKNLIIRHIRIRGIHNFDHYYNKDGKRNFEVQFVDNFIFDHMTTSGSSDQSYNVATIFGDESGKGTIQWCSVEESALWGQGGADHGKGNHNLAVPLGGGNISFHHNIIANHAGRIPVVGNLLDNDIFDMRNNYIYQHGGVEFIYGKSSVQRFNVVNNCYSQGSLTRKDLYDRIIIGDLIWYIDRPVRGIYYPRNFSGNIWYKGTNPNDPPIQVWDAKRSGGSTSIPDFINIGSSSQPESSFSDTPAPAAYVETQTAEQGCELSLQKAGAWPRDFTTYRTIKEIRTKTGQAGVHGPIEYFPEIKGPTSDLYDTDRDAMPDSWEISHGLNPNDAEDRNKIVPAGASSGDKYKGFSYVEYYLNELSDNIIGKEGIRYKISTNVVPKDAEPIMIFGKNTSDAGTIVPYIGSYGQEDFAQSGYNAPYWFGNINFGDAEYNSGSIVVMKAKPRLGYVFDHWEGSPVDGLTSTQISFPVTSDTIITAHFKKLENINIGVSISPIGSGNVAGSGIYSKGDIVTLAAYSNNGYKFKRWVGGPLDNAPNPVIQFSADNSYSITAEFEAGSGGDVLIDDFNDKDVNSFIVNSEGNPKKWTTSSRYRFKEIGPGNFAYNVSSAIKDQYSVLIFGSNDASYFGAPESATSEIPQGTTVIKIRIYNIGDKIAKAVTMSPYDFGRNTYNGVSGIMYFYMGNLSYYTNPWNIGPLYYDKPLRFPEIKPGESWILEMPINLIKTIDMKKRIKVGDQYRTIDFGNIFGIWGTPIAIDDVAFGRASVDPITVPNLPPVANAGIDQVTRDLDNNGKELVWLNGIKSYDSDGGLITKWSWSENGQQIANTYAPSVELSVGVHNIILTVNDESNVTSSDNVVINVLGK